MPYEVESPLGGAMGFVGSFLKARQDKMTSDAELARQNQQQGFENTLAVKDYGLRAKESGLRGQEFASQQKQLARGNRIEDLARSSTQANTILKTRLAQMTQGLTAAAQRAVMTGKYDPATFAQAVGHIAYTLTQRIKSEHPGVTDADLDVLGAVSTIVDPVTAQASTAQKQSLDVYKAQTGRISAEGTIAGKQATSDREEAAAGLDNAKLAILMRTGRLPGSAQPGLTGQQSVSDADRTMQSFQQTYTRYSTPGQMGAPALLSQQDYKGNAVTDPVAQNKALASNMRILGAARDNLDNSPNPIATAKKMLQSNGTPSSSYLGNLILQYARAAAAARRLQSGGSDAAAPFRP